MSLSCEKQVNANQCCQPARRENIKTRSGWSRGGEIGIWFTTSLAMVLLPKCPACLALYVLCITGTSISVASATKLQVLILTLSVMVLLCMVLKHFYLKSVKHHNIECTRNGAIARPLGRARNSVDPLSYSIRNWLS